jgi:nucleotide-binding universal stress UspA family protein
MKLLRLQKIKMANRIDLVKDTEIVLLSGHPGKTITYYAKKILADCIIVESHRSEVKDLFLDSTATRIMRFTPCSV